MSYKLVAIDVDGTLINNDYKIPPYNKEVIKQLYSEGVQFVIASGRNDWHVKGYVDELGISNLVIGCNGAQVRNLKSKELFVLEPIDKKVLKELFALMDRENIIFKAFSLDTIYITENVEEDYLARMEIRADLGSDEESRMKCITATSDEIAEKEIIKVIVTHETDTEYLSEVHKKINVIEGIQVARSAAICVDMAKYGVSKGSGLKHLAEKLGIKPEEVIAIGDGGNDKEMLQYAGLSVAMGNAENELKEIADMVAESNEEAGLGKILWKIFKEN